MVFAASKRISFFWLDKLSVCSGSRSTADDVFGITHSPDVMSCFWAKCAQPPRGCCGRTGNGRQDRRMRADTDDGIALTRVHGEEPGLTDPGT